MTKLNFKSFFVYTGVSKKHKQEADVRETFADLLYTGVNGIRSHALALKIYQSEGETEFTDDEVAMIKRTAETHCIPGFIDGLMEQIDRETKDDSDLQYINPIK